MPWRPRWLGASWLASWVACGMRSTSDSRRGVTLLVLRIRVYQGASWPSRGKAAPRAGCLAVLPGYAPVRVVTATLPMAGADTPLALRRTVGHFGIARTPRARDTGPTLSR